MDNLDALLFFALFMAFVSAFPTEDERRSMSVGEFFYALFYRFLQAACMNIKSLNPALAGVSQKVEVTTVDGRGAMSKKTTETTAVQETPK